MFFLVLFIDFHIYPLLPLDIIYNFDNVTLTSEHLFSVPSEVALKVRIHVSLLSLYNLHAVFWIFAYSSIITAY